MSKERLDKLEKDVEKIMRQKAIEREVERVIESQKAGLFKYFLDILKIITALIILGTAGDKALEKYPWINELIK